MKQCILLSHLYIKENEDYKIEILDFCINHYRKHNPNAYIILTGHGLHPYNTEKIDYVYWQDKILKSEINKGHPYLVNIGLQHAKEKGYNRILKTRADGVHLIPNFFEYCHNLLKNNKLLITQQTKIDTPSMGDLFLFGETDFLIKCWNYDTWHPTKTGLTSLAKNFLVASKTSSWHDALRQNCSFVDIYNLKWIDFRANWDNLKKSKKEINFNRLDQWHRFLWGAKEDWNKFTSDGKLEKKDLNLFTEEIWNEVYSS